MAEANSSSLVSSHKSSDSDIHVHLHPLVLLTVSDLITRHALRRREGPIVGALLGQHSGRDITLEHAFECQVAQRGRDDAVLHQTWFEERLQQYKDVHKDPALEFVGWFTTTPPTGPEKQHVPIHQQIIHDYNEAAVLLAFHPSTALAGATQGGKLPLTVYESVYENAPGAGKNVSQESGEDRPMDLDTQDSPLDLKFRELPYSVETGEAEMISIDFVARGSGNATNIDTSLNQKGKAQASQRPMGEVSPKDGKTLPEAKALNDSSNLSPEDEELITSLTARTNAVKMLHARVQVLRSYLTSLPTSHLTTPSTSDQTTAPETPTSSPTEINHTILRSIQALIHRLPLLVPADGAAFEEESLAEKSDVALVTLLGDLTRGTNNSREMGRKFGIVNSAKQRRRPGRMMGQTYGDTDELAEEQAFTNSGEPYD
ncbi:MAG: hypothetical protein Q9222_003384 [Ikaeria aurantiellina]